MKLTRHAYPCLSNSVRVTVLHDKGTLSNLGNGKWITISRETLELLRCRNAHELLQRCLESGISSDESSNFISTLQEFGFISAQENPTFPKKIALGVCLFQCYQILQPILSSVLL